MNERAISFGPFRLLAAQRLLLEGDKPVRLGSRAFDILAALVERAGCVVGKEELVARAWPRLFVEDSNLKMQVSALRRALGDGHGNRRYIVTVPGQGYNFVAQVSVEEASLPSQPPAITLPAAHNLPFAVTRMIGREHAVTALVTWVSRARLVTIVGPGGIGKTTVALAVAERVVAEYADGVWLVDLAPLGDPDLVPSAVATVLGLEVRADDPFSGLVARIRNKRMLLLLDSCEHVIDAAAKLSTAILTGAPGVKIFATSREPLRVPGERDYRLGPLTSPQTSSNVTAAEAAGFSAVQLFIERAAAMVEDFALTDANAPLVVEICRRLDGVPLAIEFVAPRVEVLGVEGLAARLDDSPPLLGGARRSATPRHRTMRTVLDWSYDLLNEDEQQFFRALGIFSGGFAVEALATVVADAETARIDTMDKLADLVAKSLVVADVAGAEPRFRLLDTIRAYALEKLEASGDRQRIARRHAASFRDLFTRAESEVAVRPADEWLSEYTREIDNLRAALDWAFAPGGDRAIGVLLTAAAVPLWLCLSLLEECRRRVEKALAGLAALSSRDEHSEMRLLSALGAAHLLTSGSTPRAEAAWQRALEIAQSLGDRDYSLRALWGLYVHSFTNGHYREVLAFAKRFHSIAVQGTDPTEVVIGERLIGGALHLLGDQTAARPYLERALVSDTIADRRHLLRFQFDQRVAARGFLARTLWLQGFAEQAIHVAQSGIDVARTVDHPVSLFYALIQAACPVSLLAGDLPAGDRFVTMLFELSSRYAIAAWSVWARCYQGMLLTRRNDAATGSDLLQAALGELSEPAFHMHYTFFTAELARALGYAGKPAQGLVAINRALARSERNEEGWCVAELLRIKGELLLGDGRGAAAAEDHFRQALACARRQGAPAWELRAAVSLARQLRDLRRCAEAVAVLQPLYQQFTEGFGSADLIEARQLLDELSVPDRDAGKHAGLR